MSYPQRTLDLHPARKGVKGRVTGDKTLNNPSGTLVVKKTGQSAFPKEPTRSSMRQPKTHTIGSNTGYANEAERVIYERILNEQEAVDTNMETLRGAMADVQQPPRPTTTSEDKSSGSDSMDTNTMMMITAAAATVLFIILS